MFPSGTQEVPWVCEGWCILPSATEIIDETQEHPKTINDIHWNFLCARDFSSKAWFSFILESAEGGNSRFECWWLPHISLASLCGSGEQLRQCEAWNDGARSGHGGLLEPFPISSAQPSSICQSWGGWVLNTCRADCLFRSCARLGWQDANAQFCASWVWSIRIKCQCSVLSALSVSDFQSYFWVSRAH